MPAPASYYSIYYATHLVDWSDNAHYLLRASGHELTASSTSSRNVFAL